MVLRQLVKIPDIRVRHINAPFDAPFWWTAGLYGGASKSVIEVETDEGLVGLGEAPRWHFGEVVKGEIAPALIGAGDVICDGPFRQTNNVVRVPEGDGLGVALDPQAMKHWANHFAEHGPMGHFSDTGRPGRHRRLPLN